VLRSCRQVANGAAGNGTGAARLDRRTKVSTEQAHAVCLKSEQTRALALKKAGLVFLSERSLPVCSAFSDVPPDGAGARGRCCGAGAGAWALRRLLCQPVHHRRQRGEGIATPMSVELLLLREYGLSFRESVSEFSVSPGLKIGDETFIIAALMAMRHPKSTVLSGALSALVVMTVGETEAFVVRSSYLVG